ncbi:MAG: deoxyribonuclease IV [Thermodesulfobacteriota bacterium]
MSKLYLGAHMSVAGGLHLAIDRIRQVDGTALQIFSRNQRQWRAKPVSLDEVAAFREAWQQWGDYPIASHASYLINLASAKEEGWHKSQGALLLEFERCAALGVPAIVLHPGSHGGAGVEQGVERVVAAVDQVLAQAPEGVALLLETTAGQGTGLGADFAELAAIISASRFPQRLGVCLDTCHVFAAGYDISSAAGFHDTLADFDRTVGLDRLRFIHLNDSKKPLASRVDRHDHIGAGEIGLEGFRLLMNEPRLAQIPMTLETPKGEDLAEDKVNLATLRGLVNNEP